MWMDRYVFVVCNKQYASTWTGMLMNSYNSRYVNSWWQCAELPFWQVPFKKNLKKLSLLFLSFNRFILRTWYWSVVAVCCLALLLTLLCVFPCRLVLCISVRNSVVYTCLFLRELIVWSVFPVCAHCPAEIMMFIVPDRGLRGRQRWRRTLPPLFPPQPSRVGR